MSTQTTQPSESSLQLVKLADNIPEATSSSVGSVKLEVSPQTKPLGLAKQVITINPKTLDFVQLRDENGNILGTIEFNGGDRVRFVSPLDPFDSYNAGFLCHSCGKLVSKSCVVKVNILYIHGKYFQQVFCPSCHK